MSIILPRFFQLEGQKAGALNAGYHLSLVFGFSLSALNLSLPLTFVVSALLSSYSAGEGSEAKYKRMHTKCGKLSTLDKPESTWNDLLYLRVKSHVDCWDVAQCTIGVWSVPCTTQISLCPTFKSTLFLILQGDA